MNYYNPYIYNVPFNISSETQKIGLFSKLFGGISLEKIFDGTQKVLNIANQAIPLVKQIRPMIGNAKTMFKVMNEFKKVETPTRKMHNKKVNIDNNTNGPMFFA